MNTSEVSSQQAATSPSLVVSADAQRVGESKAHKKLRRSSVRRHEEEARAQEKADTLAANLIVFKGTFGVTVLPQEQTPASHAQTFHEIDSLNMSLEGMSVIVRARVHTVTKKGKLAFMMLRDNQCSVQATAVTGDLQAPKELIDFIGQIPVESIVDVVGVVARVEVPINIATQRDVEVKISKVHIVSQASRALPFTAQDAKINDAINLSTRLDHRWMDLRSQAANAIFKIQSRVGQYFREFLTDLDFTEIHSPRIARHSTKVRDDILTESPQLYAQMAVQGDLKRVFEVGPVYRPYHSNTHRHLTEFVGLDMEMAINEHYYEVLDVAEALFGFMFVKLLKHTKELEAIRAQYTFEDLVFQVTPETIAELGIGIIDENVPSTDEYLACIHNRERRMIRIPYAKCIALVNSSQPHKLEEADYMSVSDERLLGRLVRQRYGVDWFVCDGLPATFRRCCTMPSAGDDRFSNSFGVYVRGTKVASGAQRLHHASQLISAAPPNNSALVHHIPFTESLQCGSWPHGGFRAGLERIVMQYLSLPNIRFASLSAKVEIDAPIFAHDPKSLRLPFY
ncbi:aspartyl-tRNA synthetase, putative [Bodo saltans]|uniref:aspartate--tRNA ligase n=1 Tax=Bodo saltans TaxID=75058 RepID=A0A0S4INT6_BODSA|nr:aspartyl-tRNA synthetase, putative [Bodo saltans]|eukprot:CUE67699.1 aspartyl-tRNA synthetase, putative [Bodo saltans]